MEFDWNPKKHAGVLSTRNIDFGAVVAGFSDPNRKVTVDNRKDYGETRYNMLAKVNGRIFHITFTQRGNVTRIITAWKANRREQRRYES